MKEIRLQNIIMLTIAGLVNAFGITVFLAPVKLYDSGISGTAMLLSQITPEYLTLSLFLLILNIPLFIFGYKKHFILDRFQISKMRDIVHNIDNRAYITITEVADIFKANM